MPRIVEFAATMRNHPEWRSIPIVVLTAKDLTEDELARLNGNVHRVLNKKGCSREELMHQVRDLLADWALTAETAKHPQNGKVNTHA